MADVATLTLADFLLARIAEDQELATLHEWPFGYTAAETAASRRGLAECEAKRLIVERFRAIAAGQGETIELAFHEQGLYEALTFLTVPYSDHPDCREEWTP